MRKDISLIVINCCIVLIAMHSYAFGYEKFSVIYIGLFPVALCYVLIQYVSQISDWQLKRFNRLLRSSKRASGMLVSIDKLQTMATPQLGYITRKYMILRVAMQIFVILSLLAIFPAVNCAEFSVATVCILAVLLTQRMCATEDTFIVYRVNVVVTWSAITMFYLLSAVDGIMLVN